MPCLACSCPVRVKDEAKECRFTKVSNVEAPPCGEICECNHREVRWMDHHITIVEWSGVAVKVKVKVKVEVCDL